MLSTLLTADTIIADLSASDKEAVIAELVARLQTMNLVADGEMVQKALMDREKLGSTGIGNNVAIPHAKSDALEGLVAAFGISRAGVDFDSLDHKKVFYVFLLMAPKGEPEKHLKVLARISRLFRDDALRGRLEKAATAEDILGVIEETERSF